MSRSYSRAEILVTLGARAGYAAKGLVYLMIGGFASLAAAGLGREGLGTKEAINQLVTTPYGDAMLTLLAVGLFAYAVWRLLQAALDTEQAGKAPKGVVTRLGFAISGLVYGSLGLYCIDLLRHAARSTDQGSAQDRTALLMSHQGGIYLIFAIGLVLMGMGMRQLWRALHRTYLKNWYSHHLGPVQQRLAEGITRWGLSARGVVFMITGLFLCIAAWQADPSEAKGLGGALAVLARQPFGPWLLGAVALGLASYGIYCLINAAIRDTTVD